jgi:hypothetical protein
MCEPIDDEVCQCKGARIICACGICQKCGRSITRRVIKNEKSRQKKRN